MNKLLLIPLLIFISILIAGIYGILHDQVTYTLSEEYYTKFKFPQFSIGNYGGKAPEVILPNPRLGVAWVGFLATWWVGLIIGGVLGLVGIIHKTAKQMFRITLKAILLNVVIVFVSGILGFISGKYILSELNGDFWVPDNIFDVESFVTVGWIHTFGYLGGLAGLVAGIIYSVKQKNNLH